MNNICPYCNTTYEFLKRPLAHAKKCSMRTTDDIQKIRYDVIVARHNITPKDVIEDYTTNLLSLPDINKKYGIDMGYICIILDYNNIPRRTFSAAANLPNTRKKYKDTCIEKFGVDNVSKCDEIKIKKEHTFLEHYGVTNIRKSKEFNDYITERCLERYGKKRCNNPQLISETRKKFSREKWDNIREKYKKTCLERYGISNPLLTGSISKLEKRIGKILIDAEIKIISQYEHKKKFYDFFLPDVNFVIEVNGDYWHANPEIYTEDDVMVFPGQVHKNVGDIWLQDQKKIKSILDSGVDIIILWEKDINKMSDEEILYSILDEIGKNKPDQKNKFTIKEI
jgi:G:T-mismatch repair DNA endonuclease (very short patch repair protein)